MKKNLPIIGAFVALVVIGGVALANLNHQNQTLKAETAERDEELGDLAKQLQSIRAELKNSQKQLEKSRGLQVSNPDDALQKYMAKQIELNEGIKLEDPTEEPPTVPTPNTNAPVISAEESVLDLGTIKQSEGVVSGNFVLKNLGGKPLTIYSAFSSCGCTTVPIKDKTIPPGGSTELGIEYDPNYFKGSLGLGEIKKRVTVISNDRANPFLHLHMKVDVIP